MNRTLSTFSRLERLLQQAHTISTTVPLFMLPYPAPPLLTMTLPGKKAEVFASLLQHGILYPVEQPVALGDFLLSLPGFSQEYLEQCVQTIFINGAAADSFDAVLAPGSIVALSAAMPGLAGAIFRRQGLHSSLRSQVASTRAVAAEGPGFIKVKFFNHIAIDRACDVLSRGALVEGRAWHDFAARRADIFQAPATLILNQEAIEYKRLLQEVDKYPMINLQIQG